MTKSFIPVNEPLLDGNELKYVTEAIETGWISSEGPFVKEFEEKFSQRVSRKHGVAVANGTAALEIAVKALGIGSGDEVIIPTFTIISCAGAVVKTGATPVYVDADPITWNMNVDQIEGKITTKTKAIMAVHIYGLTVDMDPLMDIAKKYGLMVIEDAAQAIGQTYKGIPCGSFGDISVFSFYPNKHITTGEGGMVVTNDEAIAEKCSGYRNLCFKKEQRFVHDELGWNYRMTNVQAAIGLAQLETLDNHLIKKREIGLAYLNGLKNCNKLQLPLEKTEYCENLFWVFGLVIKDESLGDAKRVMASLGENGIGTRPFFFPMHKQPVFKKNINIKDESQLKVSDSISSKGLYIPSGLGISKKEIEAISLVLNEIIYE